jgi:hypothetical protein
MASPGKCAVCGAVDRPVIDFGMDLDYYGAVLFCVDDLRSALEVAELYEDPAARTQTVPLQFLDVEAVNEYLARSNVAARALNSILAGYITASALDDKPAEESDVIHDESTDSAERDSEQGDKLLISEGPVSVPASGSLPDPFDI